MPGVSPVGRVHGGPQLFARMDTGMMAPIGAIMSDAASGKKTILVADDDANISQFVKSLLEQDGHRCVCASDGKEALALFAEIHPDLVIVDLLMPQVNGYEVAKAVKQGPHPPPVVLFTAISHSIPGEFKPELVDLWLKKPINGTKLRKSVTKLLTS